MIAVFYKTRRCADWTNALDHIIEKDSLRNAEEYLKLNDLIAERTPAVAPLIYYPLAAFTLTALARNPISDYWNYPPPYFAFTQWQWW